jgi:thiopeptide-type bacteriocin biosynthesis protein
VAAAEAPVWRALHIYLNDTGATERFLRDEIAPRMATSAGACAGWFFIRYWEGGQHIRLRLCGLPDDRFDALASALRIATEHYRAERPLDRHSYLAGLTPELRATAVGDADLFYDEGSVVELAYVPELQRYGGPVAISANEDLFKISSEIALKIIAETVDRPQARLALSRDLMLAGAASLVVDPIDLARFFADYGRFWHGLAGHAAADLSALKQAGAAKRAATHAQLAAMLAGGNGLAQIWHQRCCALVDELRGIAAAGELHTGNGVGGADPVAASLRTIIGSQLHMLNNRLGMGPAREFALATILAAALEAPQPLAAG